MRNATWGHAASLLLLITAGLSRVDACTFRRGDANLDSGVDISDPVRILNILFLGNEKPDCDDLLDANDDGGVDISDSVYLLTFLFAGGSAPPAPFPGCGLDETPDALGCVSYFACSPTCLEPAAVLQALSTLTATGTCVLPGMPPIQAGVALVRILPASEAKPCGTPPAPGWPVELTTAEGTIDLPGKTARSHFEGRIVDLPVVVDSIVDTECAVDVDFDADAVLALALHSSGEKLYFTGVTGIDFEDIHIQVSATGGFVCDLGEVIVGFVQDLILPTLEESIVAQLLTLGEQLGCREICTAP